MRSCTNGIVSLCFTSLGKLDCCLMVILSNTWFKLWLSYVESQFVHYTTWHFKPSFFNGGGFVGTGSLELLI